MKIVIICKFLDLGLLGNKTQISLLDSVKQNYFGHFKFGFFDKILRHPRNRFLEFFWNLGVKIIGSNG